MKKTSLMKSQSRVWLMMLVALSAVFWGAAFSKAEAAGKCNPDKEVPFDIGITTGGEKGTYFQFGKDLQKLARDKLDLKLGVLASPGSLENMRRVQKERDAQLGIVQHDVLARIKELPSISSTDPCHASENQMISNTRVVAPLYDEEVHILARREAGINGLSDLHNKTVAIGVQSSGSAITAERLFLLAGVLPRRKPPIGGEEALRELKEGNIDAMVYVAGAPVPLFVEQVKRSDNLRFVPISLGRNPDVYEVDQWLDSSSYPWMQERVRTVAVKAILVTYDFKPPSEDWKRLNKGKESKCEMVDRIACLIWKNLGQLRRTGHKKWQSVDLDARVKGWRLPVCVRREKFKDMDSDCKLYKWY